MSGLGGAAAVFWFLVKVLLADEKELDPADYDMIGVLGRVSSTVREGGTGEMIFSQNGVTPRRQHPQRNRRSHRQGRGSGGHAIRERHRVRAPLGRNQRDGRIAGSSDQ